MGLKTLLLRLTPKPIQWLFARPYIAGTTREQAMAVVDRLWTKHGFHSTVDLLGEHVESAAQVRVEMAEYLALIDAIGDRQYANASIKLSALGQGLDDELMWSSITAFAAKARARDQFFRIDMEDIETVDRTLATYRRLREAGVDPCGIVLQSRLHRTDADIESLRDLVPNVRACIGIYLQTADVALTDRAAMKDRLFDQVRAMIGHGQSVAVATHDVALLRRCRAYFEAEGVSKSRVEFQMLLGVPRLTIQRELADAGYTVRVYVPYGRQWHAYGRRRMLANPTLIGYVLRNLFTRQRAAGR